MCVCVALCNSGVVIAFLLLLKNFSFYASVLKLHKCGAVILISLKNSILAIISAIKFYYACVQIANFGYYFCCGNKNM